MNDANLQSLCSCSNTSECKVSEKYLTIIKALIKLFKSEAKARKQANRFIEAKGFKDEYYESLSA